MCNAMHNTYFNVESINAGHRRSYEVTCIPPIRDEPLCANRHIHLSDAVGGAK